MGRTRSQGWSHAKKDGHDNEKSFAEQILSDALLLSRLEEFLKEKPNSGEVEVEVDGSKHVLSILGDSTTSKVDMCIKWGSGIRLNLSVKKSNSGQVWLISLPRFIQAIEFHLASAIDEKVRMGLSLFIGGTNLVGVEELFEQAIFQDKKRKVRYLKLQQRQSRLVSQSLISNHKSLWDATLEFFNENIELITHLSFAQGLAVYEEDAADVIVYNKVDGGPKFFATSLLRQSTKNYTEINPIIPGPRNGGSTLLLPTGFLQMHHPKNENLLQFHHQYNKLVDLQLP